MLSHKGIERFWNIQFLAYNYLESQRYEWESGEGLTIGDVCPFLVMSVILQESSNLAKQPSKSINLRFNQGNLYIRLAKEVCEENEYLCSFGNGIEMENDRLPDKNKKFALFSTILNSITFLICGKANQNDSLLTNENYQTIKSYTNKTFDRLFSVLPNDITNRKNIFWERH